MTAFASDLVNSPMNNVPEVIHSLSPLRYWQVNNLKPSAAIGGNMLTMLEKCTPIAWKILL